MKLLSARWFYLVLTLNLPVSSLAQEQAATAAPTLTQAEIEEFLLKAKILKRKALSVGVTNSERATLSDGKLTHDAHIQTVDIKKTTFQTQRGTELNFRDTYKFNIAAYRLCNILDFDRTPPSVERKVGGNMAAVTWWVDDVLMTELDRFKNKVQPPNPDAWNNQIYSVKVFDELIYNTDRNLGNLVITKDWRVWMIDHTRGFRLLTELQTPKNLVKCDRRLLASLRKLDQDLLTKALMPYVTKEEIKGLLARRDLIIKFFDDEIAKKGESAVLYDLPN